ncbi:unknown [Brachyspira sp. CAG:484]|nr:unknown [Brachyspira sp. CAG:484]
MDKNLSIQEIKLLAEFKTNNKNISEQEAIDILNSVLPDFGKLQSCNSWAVQSANPSAFGSNNLVSGIKECEQMPDSTVFNNLISKLGYAKKTEKPEKKPVYIAPVEPSGEDIELIAVDYLNSDLQKAQALVKTQKNSEGAVSKLFNSGKELFNTEFASSNVERILAVEQIGNSMLAMATGDALSVKQYLETKLNLAVKLLPEAENAEEVRLIKQELSKLRPTDLNQFISSLAALEDSEYVQKAPVIKKNLITNALQANIQTKFKDFEVPKFTAPATVKGMLESQDAYKVMEFEKAYELERGVKFNPDAITDYAAKEARMTLVLAVRNRNNQIKELLHNPTVTVDGNNKYGEPFGGAMEICINNLERCVNAALYRLYGNDEDLINRFLEDTGTSFKDGRLEYGTFAVKSYTLVNISNKLQETLDSNYNKLLDGKPLEEIELDCKQTYNLAYGAEHGSRLAQAFVESQMKGVQYIKTGVQGAGMLILIAGQFIPVGGQAASAMVLSGLGTAAFGGTAVQLTEDLTKAGGITEEDKQAITKELVVSTALLTAGAGIGKMSSLAYSELVMANCPRLIALSAKIGADATMSLLADWVITGQVDLTSEGISQLIPIVTGILKTKGSMYTYVSRKLQEISDPESLKYWDANPEKLTELVQILSKNHTPIGKLSQLSPAHWDVIINSVKHPATGKIHESMMVYKDDSREINWALTDLKKNNIQPSPKIQSHIDNITAYIDQQRIKEPIKVYRDDSYGILDIVTLSNNKSLGTELKNIANIKDVEIRERLLDKIRREDITIYQERFMSTSMCEDVHFNKSDIRWEFDLPAGTKGTFIESYNTKTTHGNQVEFLLQRNSQILIKDIEYENGIWKIYANIKN